MSRVDLTGSEIKDGTSKWLGLKHSLRSIRGEAKFDVQEYELPKVLADILLRFLNLFSPIV